MIVLLQQQIYGLQFNTFEAILFMPLNAVLILTTKSV